MEFCKNYDQVCEKYYNFIILIFQRLITEVIFKFFKFIDSLFLYCIILYLLISVSFITKGLLLIPAMYFLSTK